MNRATFALAASVSTGLASLVAQPGHAQALDPGRVGEVVVTAQRREERSQDVPISLTVRSGDQLDRAGVTETSALGKMTPSLVMTRSGAFTQPYLRGVGKRSTLGVENSVATYIDGVYLASSISALQDLRGLDRIEILNGPQGTLFGRNTSGGVIQIITKDPQPGAFGEIALHAGTYEYLRGDAYLTGGTDRLAGNLAVSLSRNGGYGSNAFSGQTDQGETDHSLVARSKWVWRAAESLRLTLAGDYQDIDQDFAFRPLAGYPPISNPRIGGFRDGDQNAPNRFHFRYGGVSLRADAAVAGLNLVSLTAQRWLRARYASDLDLGPEPLVSAAPNARQRQFSQEFQLQSGEAAPFLWLAGLYYIRIREEYDPTTFDYGGAYAARLGGRIHQTLFSLGTASSYAAFGQATARLGARTRLTAGLRYTIERRSVEASGEQLFNVPPLVRAIPGLPLTREPPLRRDETFRELTWRAALDHRLSDTLMGYASVSRGFQSGGWNLQTPQVAPFDPERLDALEAGLKFTGAAGRFAAEASVFYYDYSDLQVSAFTPLGSVTTNATSANVYGLDIQVTGRLVEATDVTLGAQVLKARFDSFRNATCTNFDPAAAVRYAPISCDASGNRLPFAPRFKLNLGVTHRVVLGDHGTLTLNGNAAYDSGYYSDPDNIVRQKAFSTLDASVAWQAINGGPTLRVWAQNLTDANSFDVLAVFPTASVIYRPAAPRRVGATAVFAF